MDKDTLTQEQRILVIMRTVLANIVKDTTPQPGMLHPLSESTIEDIRHCFTMISLRESELAEETGLVNNERPYFVDTPPQAKVMPLRKIDLAGKRDKES